MFDHHITQEEVRRLINKEATNQTNQEDVPRDILETFPDFIKQHNCCPRCKQNGQREQISCLNEPLRFRCCSCGGVSLSSDWQ